jgi:anti-sigma B factor antagonist
MLEVDMVVGVPVVTAPEEIDLTNVSGLRAALQAAVATGSPAFVVDMTTTRFCDSAGLRVLVDAHKRAVAEGGAVLLAVPAAAVLRVLEITGIDQVIPGFDSLDEAVAHATEYPG